MMKAILMSIQSPHVCNILNLIKLWEIRKKFPKDYVGWVYIYCTKDKKYANLINRGGFLTGMVVARFWCDKVEDYVNGSKLAFENGTYIFGTNADFETILKPSCLTEDELYDYCEDLSFKAIHITNLEIFDEPKEISEFKHQVVYKNIYTNEKRYLREPLRKAPQSFCFIEIE